ncbi:hypothetical protein RB195_015425 [Necator americanus]|uniref:Leishmanolysin-like peptidase n=1 Tax=Necator americanus TaxID=51031 RepID=A0ABR1E4R6_NECAM
MPLRVPCLRMSATCKLLFITSFYTAIVRQPAPTSALHSRGDIIPDPMDLLGISRCLESHYSEIVEYIKVLSENHRQPPPRFTKLSEEKQELLEDLITNARDYFETTIKVQRLSSIQLQPTCKGEGYIVNGHIECDYDCEKRCGKAIASPLAHYFTNCRCTKQDCETKQKNWGGKLRDADFVLFVLVSNERCTSMTLAYAAHCSLDKQTNRPVAGFVNVCPNAFNNMKSNDVTQWEATIKHELIHAFVFSTTLYTKYQGITRTSTKEGSMVLVPGVIERFKRVDWESAAGIVSHDVYMMVTPKVREEARKHFQCPDLEGAEIENQGGPATAGVHWEKRVFENEAMTGVATQVYALSRITLALFEDSGWYQVNYNKAEPMSWGHELGCKFAKQSCLTWMRTNPNNPYPFCTVVGDKRCSTNRRAKVTCNLMTDSMNVSSEYDYNVPNLYRDLDGHSVHGYGNLPTADYCPYYREPSEENVSIAFTEYPPEPRPKRSTPLWESIRIETEYDPSIYLLSKSKQETLKDLITAARDYFESTLKVQRLFSLQLRSKCKNSEGLNLGGVTYCQDDCAKRCGDARASKEAQYFSECVCNGPCETEQGNWGGVLRNADFVFFVSVDGRKCDQRTMAFASHCAYDEYSRRQNEKREIHGPVHFRDAREFDHHFCHGGFQFVLKLKTHGYPKRSLISVTRCSSLSLDSSFDQLPDL